MVAINDRLVGLLLSLGRAGLIALGAVQLAILVLEA